MLTRIEIINARNRVRQVVEGKLLGLLTDKQYAIISKKPDIRKKLITGEVCRLDDVSDILLKDPYTTYRLVVSAKFIDGLPKGKHLFITDRLNMLTKCIQDKGTRVVEVWVDDDTNVTMVEKMEES